MTYSLLLLTALAANASPPSADLDFFEKKIRPALDTHCISCHSAAKMRGGLRLDSRAALLKGGDTGPAIVPGHPDKSLLLTALRYHKEDLRMPPKGKLPDPVIQDFASWVQRGAVWPETVVASGDAMIRSPGTPITEKDRAFWSFRPVANPPLPAVKKADWVKKPLDQFILARLEEKGLAPVKPADRRALIRRVTFDLLGLPPTPEEIEAFVNDSAPTAYEKVLDRLLASSAYGEKWGRHWLDVARYAEDQAHTFAARLYPQGYRYRDWVVKALNDDLPYDQFIIHQIAGDLVEGGNKNDRLAALGFFALGPVYYNDAGEAGVAEASELDDRLDTVCRGFLGLTVACARCHDHKFDPIPASDYYSMAGVFRSSQYQLAFLASDSEVANYQAGQTRIKEQDGRIKKFLDEETIRASERLSEEVARYALAAWKLHLRRQADNKIQAQVVAKEEKVEPAVLDKVTPHLFKDAGSKPYLAAWTKALMGLDAKDSASRAKVETAAAELQKQIQDLLAKRQEEGKGGKKLDPAQAKAYQELFGNQGVFRVDARRAESTLDAAGKKTLAELRGTLEKLKKEAPPSPPTVHTLTEGKAADMPIYLRGSPSKPGEIVPRRFLRILSGEEPQRFTKGSGRLELAQAIASKDNPLTARVMVNRIWMNHFGKGLVGTPSNFGILGERPTHPELLDHLAKRFVDLKWSIKALHREILLSATYQLSSDLDAKNNASDPANRLYWRMDRRKLDVEQWRDALLAVGGNLDLRLGGPPTDLNAGGNKRRTIYGSVSRHNLSGLLRLFDFPDPNLSSEKRSATIVPLQQLFVLNSDFMIEQARGLARRLSAESNEEARIRSAYLLLYGRAARPAEVQMGLAFLTAPEESLAPGETKPTLTRWEEYAQVLLAANEFTFVD